MRRVLIIEDNEETLNNLKTGFESIGLETICCYDNDSVDKALSSNISFEAVILDWFFVLDESSNYSKNILKKLKEKYFVPVFVFTGHLTDFENQTEEELGYPKNMIDVHDKSIGVVELQSRIERMLKNNIAYNLSVKYRDKIHSHLEKVFFDLNASENSSLGKVLKTIYGDGENIDWNNDIIVTMLHRSLISDDDFIKSISETLKNLNIDDFNNPEFNKKLLSRIIYHYGKSDYIRNGDIVTIRKFDDTVIGYGIVVTPDCDLEQMKTRLIDIVELVIINDAKLKLKNEQIMNIKKYNHDSFFFFPAINIDDKLNDFTSILKSRFILHEKDVAENTKYPFASKRLLYSHEFVLNGSNVKLELICTIVNPYKAEFLQKLQTNNFRIGIPDIKNLY